jgi:hypothetical protein
LFLKNNLLDNGNLIYLNSRISGIPSSLSLYLLFSAQRNENIAARPKVAGKIYLNNEAAVFQTRRWV